MHITSGHLHVVQNGGGAGLAANSRSTLFYRMDCSPPSSSVQGFSWQVYWSGLPFLSPGDLPNPGMELGSPALQADSLPSELPGKPQKDKEEVRFYVN